MPWKDLIPVLAALAGALVGGFMAEFRSVTQDRRERQRALRKLLSILLELRFQLRRQDLTTLRELFIITIDRHFGRDVAAQLSAFFSGETIRGIVAAIPPEAASKAVGALFEEAVEAIAPYDPWLAYRLRGNSSVLDLEASARRDLDSIVALLAGTPTPPDGLGSVQSAATSGLLDAARDTLDQAIADTAYAPSVTDWIRARWWMYRRRGVTPAMAKDFDRYIGRILAAVGTNKPDAA